MALKRMLAAASLGFLMIAPAAAKTFVYVSAAGDGTVDIFAMDEATGALTPQGKANAGKSVMPMAVSPDKKHLYAVVRSQPFRVMTFGIDAATGALSEKTVAALPDSMPYVATDKTGRTLLTASYGGNKVAVLPIGVDGTVTAGTRQMILTGPFAHAIIPDGTNRFVYATNLGSDHVLQFTFDAQTGMLKPNDPPHVTTAKGVGPRHLVLSPDNKYLYVLGELTGDVIQYAVDPAKGTLRQLDSVASVPVDAGMIPGAPMPYPAELKADPRPKIWTADIQISPNGKFLYSTERTTNKIALFTVAPESGRLTYVANFPTEAQPRGIRIDPAGKFLVASGEKSDKLAAFAIDQATGRLNRVSQAPVGVGANWVEIVTLP